MDWARTIRWVVSSTWYCTWRATIQRCWQPWWVESLLFHCQIHGARKRWKYVQHTMPAGAKVVPADPVTGERKINGYEFFYTGWKQPIDDPSFYRDGATRGNMFPPDRKGRLDKDLLKKMGLTKERMQNGDALFFYQFLFPICHPKTHSTHLNRCKYRCKISM